MMRGPPLASLATLATLAILALAGPMMLGRFSIYLISDPSTWRWARSSSDRRRRIMADPEASYLRLALDGPRRCLRASCYIVDVVPDFYQPRVFLSMLGLPASDIQPRALRGATTNVSFVDVRTREDIAMVQSSSLTNATHGYAVSLRWGHGGDDDGGGSKSLLAHCKNLEHHGNTALGSFYESMTYSCDLPPARDKGVESMIASFFGGDSAKEKVERMITVDVLVSPKDDDDRGGGVSLNLTGDRPFYITNDRSSPSSGLFNSVTRRVNDVVSQANNVGHEVYNSRETAPKISACIIGVNYVSQQHREVIQYYISSGFSHVYLGLPQWPTAPSGLFNRTWSLLGDFVEAEKLSLIVSEYAAEYIQPEHFRRNFTYAPQGHKSSFINTCILVSRAAGDDMVFVGDMDEVVEHSYGNGTSVPQAVMNQIEERNTTLRDICSINMGAVDGHYHNAKAGYAATGKIADKLMHLGRGIGSVEVYGKTISNARRVIRVGLHTSAYCEGLPMGKISARMTRPSVKIEFRPPHENLRIMHLIDSYKKRSSKSKRRGNSSRVSYYVRDWSGLVNEELNVSRGRRK